MMMFEGLLYPDVQIGTLLEQVPFRRDLEFERSLLALQQNAPEEAENRLLDIRRICQSDDPWVLFALAESKVRLRKEKEAQDVLREVTQLAGVESRIVLWAWYALRSLGVSTRGVEHEVWGVVTEVPMNNRVGRLGIYADGRVRYVNAGDLILLWDEWDETISPLVEGVFQCVPAPGKRWPDHRRARIKDGHIRINTLTPAGIAFWEGNPSENPEMARLFNAQSFLLNEIIKRELGEKSQLAAYGWDVFPSFCSRTQYIVPLGWQE